MLTERFREGRQENEGQPVTGKVAGQGFLELRRLSLYRYIYKAAAPCRGERVQRKRYPPKAPLHPLPSVLTDPTHCGAPGHASGVRSSRPRPASRWGLPRAPRPARLTGVHRLFRPGAFHRHSGGVRSGHVEIPSNEKSMPEALGPAPGAFRFLASAFPSRSAASAGRTSPATRGAAGRGLGGGRLPRPTTAPPPRPGSRASDARGPERSGGGPSGFPDPAPEACGHRVAVPARDRQADAGRPSPQDPVSGPSEPR